MARFLGALVLCLAVAVFAVQNDQAVRLVFLGMTAPAVRLALLIIAALVLGAAVTVLLGGLQVLRLRRRLAGLERELALVRAELPSRAAHAERPLPPADDGALTQAAPAVVEHAPAEAPAAGPAATDAPPAGPDKDSDNSAPGL